MSEASTHTPPKGQLSIVVLIRDLMFASRVTSTAAQLGVTVTMLRDPARLTGEPGHRLIVDLNLAGAINAAADWKSAGLREGKPAEADEQGNRTVFGFVSHVDTETIHEARAAGIDRVMARSQFVNLLPDLLRNRVDELQSERHRDQT